MRKATGFIFLDLEPDLRAFDCRLDLGAAAYDAFVLEQPSDLPLAIVGDLRRLELIEGTTEVFALAQNRDPGQAGLDTVDGPLFIERARVELRHAPFFVVIRDVKRIFAGPG